MHFLVAMDNEAVIKQPRGSHFSNPIKAITLRLLPACNPRAFVATLPYPIINTIAYTQRVMHGMFEPVWPTGKVLSWQADYVGSIPSFGSAALRKRRRRRKRKEKKSCGTWFTDTGVL